MSQEYQNPSEKICFHCGEPCDLEVLLHEDKSFCCQGCQMVYEILSENKLNDYYRLEKNPGISLKGKKSKEFDFLENSELIEQLIDYKDSKITKLSLYIPQIHCSSCLWLLENIYKLNPSIRSSRVNFLKKELQVTYSNEMSLRELVELLQSLGYSPKISLDNLSKKKKANINRKLFYQLGLAGFAFGNIMLMSLPGYFGFDLESLERFSSWFSYINLLLASPIAIYSGQDYFRSSWYSLKNKRLNIDIPISLGILVLYSQSLYEILSKSGPGYLDSLCGLLFFLLLGKVFQEKTYQNLAFERDYKAYFPIAVSKVGKSGKEKPVPLHSVVKGDRLRIRNGEIIPVDSRLIIGEAFIDNSFISGESEPLSIELGELIYAGGKQEGESILVEALKPLNQSKLIQLWNEQSFHNKTSGSFSKITDQISQWFTPFILLVALISFLWHVSNGFGGALQVVSAVLIIACPCALALAAPFTFGHASRELGKQHLFLRDSYVVEDLASISHIVFDKTGTLTYSRNQTISYQGKALSKKESAEIRSILFQSKHPLSRMILNSLSMEELTPLLSFKEMMGKGLEASTDESQYKIGSAKWLAPALEKSHDTIVVVEKNKKYRGHFTVKNEYRAGLQELINELQKKYTLSVLSGDNEGQLPIMSKLFGNNTSIIFKQSPSDKLHFIKNLQDKGHKVMMVGDGLNDAGALKQSDVGIAVSEEENSFSPASDVIIDSVKFPLLAKFMSFSQKSKGILILAYLISFLYNLIGLTFAIQGLLSPVFAAILMPLSSITVVAFSSICVKVMGSRHWVKVPDIS